MNTQTQNELQENTHNTSHLLEAHQTLPEGFKLKRNKEGLPILVEGKYLLEEISKQQSI